MRPSSPLKSRLAAAICAVAAGFAVGAPDDSSAQDQNPGPGRAPQRPAAQPAPPQGQPQPAQPRKPVPPDENTLKIMRIWEQKSAEVKTLRVQFDRIFEQFGNPETQPGEAILKSPNLATLIYYEEDKAPNGKPYEVRYVFNGKELWKYVSREKKVFIYKVKQNQENQGVFERGPLRFLFNMKLDDALRRYEVKLLPNQKDPVIEKTYHVIKIVPLDPNELQEVSVIYVWLQKSDFMPGIIRIQSGQRKTKEDFKFTKIERNGAVNERVFVGFKPEGWKAIDNPVGEDPGFGPDPGPAAKPGAGAVGANGPGRPANAKAANGGVMPRRN